MKYIKIITLTCLCLMNIEAWADFHLHELTVEYTQKPIGIDVTNPRFGWQMVSNERGAAQKDYCIQVRDENDHEVWNSGVVKSSVALGIRYAGKTLQPMTKYRWTVTVTDLNGEQASDSSSMETGLMAISDKAPEWSNAQWIGGDQKSMAFYSSYLPVFILNGSVKLEGPSIRAGLIYGANDMRLMDRNKNILGVENGHNGSYCEVELVFSDSAMVNVYRVGYKPDDSRKKPFKTFTLKNVTKADRQKEHWIKIVSVSGTTTILVDGVEAGKLELNPIGIGGDYTAFPMVGDVGFDVGDGQKATFGDLIIRNFRSPYHELSRVKGGTFQKKLNIVTPEERGSLMLRNEFKAEHPVRKARLYVTARGIYDCFINGQRVGDDFLNPGLTQYNKTQTYQTYDVTASIQQGNNSIGAILNEGWWSGNITYSMYNWNYFGDRQALLAKLVLTYDDGSVQTVVTTPEGWQTTNDGAFRIGSIFQGEVMDARIDEKMKGWNCAGYEASAWKHAQIVKLENVISDDNPSGWPKADDYSAYRLVAQTGQPVRAFGELQAQRMEEPRKGVYVYDMGQNMAGVPKITFHNLRPGQKVVMQYAEVKYPNLPAYKGNVGMVMLENIRAAMAQDIYIAKGGEAESFEPRYTYHGFRYLEITGIEKALPLKDVKGIVLSSVDQLTADYQTSDSLLNRFFRNVTWSTLANVFSVPTDCPQRNERMGWSGDLSMFFPAMSYLFHAAPFMTRHLQAIRDTQKSTGEFADIAPIGGGFGGPLWQSAGIVLPWENYQQYGDMEALRIHYPAMQKYMSWVMDQYIDKQNHYFKGNESWSDLGDWLGFEVNKNDNSLIFDSYLVYELGIMVNSASLLGHTDEAEEYRKMQQERRQFINDHYINHVSGKTEGTGYGKEQQGWTGWYGPKRKGVLIDTQTSYTVPLALGVVEDSLKPKVMECLKTTVKRQSKGDDGKVYPVYSLMTGFVGTPWICFTLSDNGDIGDAYRMLLNRNYPSWLYPVEQGATTIWERLNSMTRDKGFGNNNSMNSFNHYAFGSVTNWLMQRSLGIARDGVSTAFKHFVICPQVDPTGLLTYARGYYDSMYGRIESGWNVKGNEIDYHVVIPANTSAELQLGVDVSKIKESNRSLKKTKGVIVKNGKIELRAGSYNFVVKK